MSTAASGSGAPPATPSSVSGELGGDERNSVVIKVGMVGDSQIGKTSLMVKYVEGSFDEDYIQTLGVNFMEKTISVRRTTITFSIWDLGGQREFVNMLPLVCNDAVAILFMFDLSRKSTLNSVKEWYRQAGHQTLRKTRPSDNQKDYPLLPPSRTPECCPKSVERTETIIPP